MSTTLLPGRTRIGMSMGGMLVFRVVGQFVTFGLWIILSRYLGPEQFGIFNYLFGLVVLFSAPLTYSFNDVLVRESVNRPIDKEKIFRVGLGLKLLISCGVFILSIIVIYSLEHFGEWQYTLNTIDSHTTGLWLIILVSSSLFFSLSIPSWRLGLEAIFQANYRMDSASIASLIGRIILLGMIMAGVIIQTNLNGIITLYALAEVLATTVLIFFIIKLGYPLIPRFDRREIGWQFTELVPLIVADTLAIVYSRIDIILIQVLSGFEDVGYFSAPVRLVDAFQILAAVFVAAAIPVLTTTFKENTEYYRQFIKWSYKAMTLVSLIIVVPVTVYSEQFVMLFYGTEFSESISVMKAAIWSLPFLIAMSVFRAVVVTEGKQRELPVFFAIMMALNIGLNYMLIPVYGPTGAAWAKVLTMLALFPVTLLFAKVRSSGSEFLTTSLAPILAAYLLAYGIEWLSVPLWTGVPLSVVVILGLSYLSGWFGKAEITRIFKIIK